jgi:hypothetical protein
MAADSGRPAGALLLAAGALLMALAWRWRAGGGLAVVQAAVAGPLSAALGLGKVLHGNHIPRDGLSRLTRIYGLAGGLAGAGYLYLVGRFSDAPAGRLRWIVPVVATLIWLIPVPAGREEGP